MKENKQAIQFLNELPTIGMGGAIIFIDNEPTWKVIYNKLCSYIEMDIILTRAAYL